MARRFPKLNVDHDALFLKDGPFYTAGGITASVDLALALIEEDYGPRVALAVARELVVFRNAPVARNNIPMLQINSTDRFADLASWMVEHMRGDLASRRVAKRVCPSATPLRQAIQTGVRRDAGRVVENLRLDEARRRLSERTQTIENVASSVGFQSDDVFRRAFQRRFGVKPSSDPSPIRCANEIAITQKKAR